jgi:hypothetical protein
MGATTTEMCRHRDQIRIQDGCLLNLLRSIAQIWRRWEDLQPALPMIRVKVPDDQVSYSKYPDSLNAKDFADLADRHLTEMKARKHWSLERWQNPLKSSWNKMKPAARMGKVATTLTVWYWRIFYARDCFTAVKWRAGCSTPQIGGGVYPTNPKPYAYLWGLPLGNWIFLTLLARDITGLTAAKDCQLWNLSWCIQMNDVCYETDPLHVTEIVV